MSVDELEREMLRQARRELAPGPGVRERHETELLARLAGGAPLGSLAGGLRLAPGSGPARPALTPRLGLSGSAGRLLGIGLAVGALLGGVAGYALGQRGAVTVADGEPGARAPLVASGDAPPLQSPLQSLPQSPAPSRVHSPVALPAEPLAAEAPRQASAELDTSTPGRATKPAERARAAREGESSLAAELAMLQRARRALAADNGRLALGIVEELDERFPRGVLLEERLATRVLGLCELERVAEARAAARDFMLRHPGSVYAERVRTSCVQTPE